ncbi:hypothetical protein PVK06_043729 [Gossypium arboreum]|uniref:Uncharacterized protein n=1 Tax=Gossypium arboreum TaxID=29729 RepID=A0ABR0MPQ4_GOSAR|nr:hypothetical protein PVK06_043729 [Gossypium arboreum]
MNKDTIPSKGTITKQLALRFSGEEILRHLGSTSKSTSSPPLNTDIAPSTSHNDDDQDDDEETTAEKKTTKKEGEAKRIESVHVESENDDDDVTQDITPTE